VLAVGMAGVLMLCGFLKRRKWRDKTSESRAVLLRVGHDFSEKIAASPSRGFGALS
jgi:hypothetical protein